MAQQNRSVRDLQGALRLIAEEFPEIDPILVDGLFGPETTRAVLQFQQRFDLPQTGTVDFNTWTRIFERANAIQAQRQPPELLDAFPSDATLTIGSTGNPVWFVQFILQALADHYENFSPILPSGTYDEATADEIRHFQRTALLPETGIVDKPIWNSLARWHRTVQTHR